MRQSVNWIKVRSVVQRGMCIKGLFWPPLKTENGLKAISFDWLFGGISEVKNFGIYLFFTVAMVTKKDDKIGLKQRNCHF